MVSKISPRIAVIARSQEGQQAPCPPDGIQPRISTAAAKVYQLTIRGAWLILGLIFWPHAESIMAKPSRRAARRGRTRGVLVSAATALVLAIVVVGVQSDRSIAQSSNFQGGAPEVSQAPDMNSIRILFPAGVRSSWHTHTWGQLLMIEEGRALTQVRGEPVREMHPGEPWWTPADVEHWHGAHPEEASLQLTIYEGSVVWMDPTTDQEYLATPIRP